MRSLRTWLSLGLAAAIVAPAVAGLGAWVLAGDWQTAREEHRLTQAIGIVSSADLADWDVVSRELSRVGVEAELNPVKPIDAVSMTKDQLKELKTAAPSFAHPGSEDGLAVPRLQAERARPTTGPSPLPARASTGHCSSRTTARPCAGRSRSAPGWWR